MNPLAPCCLLLGSALAAQSLPPANTLPPSITDGLRVPVRAGTAALDPDGGIWAAGPGYKVSFHGGMTFTPYLGAEYPKNQPWSWRTTAVRVGERDLVEPGGAAPAGRAFEYRYEYDHGGVTEAYDVLATGLEQTFVVTRRPGAGDLVVRGRVGSTLRAPTAAPGHRSLPFADEAGRPILTYGAAFAFDAAGDKIAIETSHRDGEIELTVPAAWFARAVLPVTVDPLLSPVDVFGGGPVWGTREVDIAVADTSRPQSVLMTCIRAASQFDDDIYVIACDPDYRNPWVVAAGASTAYDTDQAACAYVGGADKWVVVWREYIPTGTRFSRIIAFDHRVGSRAIVDTNDYLVVRTNVNAWRPDVGGAPVGSAATRALVVCQAENNASTSGNFANTAISEIVAAGYDVVTRRFEPYFTIAADVNDNERPSVNKSNAGVTASPWMCVWQAGIQNRWTLSGKMLGNRAVSNGTWRSDLALSSAEHEVGPVVDGAAGRYAVAFTTIDATAAPNLIGSITGNRLFLERFDWVDGASAPSPSGDKPPVLLHGDTVRRFEATGLAFDTDDVSHFTVAYRSTVPSQALAVRVGYGGHPTETGLVVSASTSATVSSVACAFDRFSDDTLFAVAASNANGWALAGRTLQYVTPAPTTTAGPACSGAILSWTGNRQIGSETERIAVALAPVAAGHFLLLSLAPTSQPIVLPNVAPGCHLLVEAVGGNYLGTLAYQAGAAVSWSFPLPEWVPPITLHFQAWILSGGQLTSTHRLSVPIVR